MAGDRSLTSTEGIFYIFFQFSAMASTLRLRPLPDERERSNVIKTQSFRPPSPSLGRRTLARQELRGQKGLAADLLGDG